MMTHFIVYKSGVVKNRVRGKHKFKDHYQFWEYIYYKAIKFLFSFVMGNGRFTCYFTCNNCCFNDNLLTTRFYYKFSTILVIQIVFLNE